MPGRLNASLFIFLVDINFVFEFFETQSEPSMSSTSSTFLVKDLKIENAKLDTKSSKEGKSPVVPNIVVITNNKNDIEDGWTDITKGNRKAKSSGNVTGAIVTEINDQQLTLTGHGTH